MLHPSETPYRCFEVSLHFANSIQTLNCFPILIYYCHTLSHPSYYFFETTETPLYHIFYAAFALGVGAMMMSYLAKGFLFIALCFYFVALYDDLKWMLVRIDRQPCVTARRRLTGQCVRVHNQIYRWVRE